MIDAIKAAVRVDGRVSGYKIVETRKQGAEWYFVGSSLDTARSVETRLYSLVAYVDAVGPDGSKTRGAYATTIHPTATTAEIAASVSRAARAASGMRNPWYPLPCPSAAASLVRSGFDGLPLESSLEGLKNALYAVEGEGIGRINSLELFLSKNDTRIVNSNGLDVSWSSYSGHVEYIASAKKPGSDGVELFGDLDFSEPDTARLTAAVRESLNMVADRLNAIPTPRIEGLPILFKGQLAAELYGYWFASTKAQAAYEKTAAFSLGGCLGDGSQGGDPIRLVAVPAIRGNARSAPFDADGQPLSPVVCVDDGTLAALFGPLKYTHYLGIGGSGDLPLFEVRAGTASVAELEAAPHVEAAAFSDFFVDGTTGDFGGELRLGYLVESGKRTAITGGSISGTMAENLGRIRLSRELAMSSSCFAPLACLVPAASIGSAG